MGIGNGQEFDDFIEKLLQAPEYVKENTMCYYYHNNTACTECPKQETCKNREPRPMKSEQKEEKVTFGNEIYLDIEGTIIDNLEDCNILHDNCKCIREMLEMIAHVSNHTRPYRVNFYTWGFKDTFDIMPFLVRKLFAELGVPGDCCGSTYTKAFSIHGAIKDGFLKAEDYDRAIQPGMMKEFGIEKVNCFIADVRNKRVDVGETSTILLDDLVDTENFPESGNSKMIRMNLEDNRILYLMNPNDLVKVVNSVTKKD